MNTTELAAYAAGGSAVAGFVSLFAATKLANIEKNRRWAELTPLFRFNLTEGRDEGSLEVLLLGPVGLDYLDTVVIRIVDEKGKTHKASKEKDSLFVRGPWEFDVAGAGQFSDKRTTVPRTYSRLPGKKKYSRLPGKKKYSRLPGKNWDLAGKNWDHLALVRTRPPPSSVMTDEEWHAQRTEHLRLAITCCRRPFQPWYLLCDVPPGTSPSR